MPSEHTNAVLPRRPRTKALRAILLLTAWYLTSSVATILTKALFSGADRRLPPFPFSLTVTATNNVIASTAANVLVVRRRPTSRDPNVNRIALVIGATTAAEIGLSNIALNLLSVSYATVLKGMAPLFVMTWGVILGLQRFHLSMLLIMLSIAAGLAMAVVGEAETKSLLSEVLKAGFVAQLCSALFSGFRWILTQVFVQGEAIGNDRVSQSLNMRPLSAPISAVETIRLTAPFTLLCVIPFVLLIEGPALMTWFLAAKYMDVVNLLTVLTVIGVCVYLLLWAEYELVKITSSLTVSVGFVLKEILIVFAGSLIFQDKLSGLTCAGFAMVQCAIVGYGLQRRDQASRKLHSDAAAPLRTGSVVRILQEP